MIHTSTPSALLTERDISGRLSISLPTIRRWRKARRRGDHTDSAGPAFIDLNGSIRYSPRDVDAYIARRTVGHSAEVAGLTAEPAEGSR